LGVWLESYFPSARKVRGVYVQGSWAGNLPGFHEVRFPLHRVIRTSFGIRSPGIGNDGIGGRAGVIFPVVAILILKSASPRVYYL
jgi:hypothetical protein